MPPFCLLNCEALCALNEKAVDMWLIIENHIWKWYERVRLKSLVCSLVKRVCLALSLIGWMLVILNLIGWFWALLLNRLCSVVVPLWVPVFFWRVIDDPSPGTAPDTARCAAEGGLGPAPETQTDSTDARHTDTGHTYKHTNTQMRRAMGKTILGFLVTSGQCWRTFCSHCLRLYITLPLSTFSF